MSTTAIQQYASSFVPSSSASQSGGMAQSQTVGLDTLAEGSQYVLDQLQLSREAAAKTVGDDTPSDSLRSSLPKSKDQPFYRDDNNSVAGSRYQPPLQRDPLVEARSAIRKNSVSAPVRRRISRACDQCNSLRTKCDGQHPCAHCIGKLFCLRRLIPSRSKSPGESAG